MIPRYFRSDGRRAALPVLAGALLSCLAAMAPQAEAAADQPVQPGCHAHEKLAQLLDFRFAERPVAAGLDAGGKLVQIFASAGGASWTLVATAPNGTACVIAVGEAWSPVSTTVTGPDA